MAKRKPGRPPVMKLCGFGCGKKVQSGKLREHERTCKTRVFKP